MANIYWGAVLLLLPFFIFPSFEVSGIRYGRDVYFCFFSFVGSFLVTPKLPKTTILSVVFLFVCSTFCLDLQMRFDHTSKGFIFQSLCFLSGVLFLAQTHTIRIEKYIIYACFIHSSFMILDHMGIDLVRMFFNAFSNYSMTASNRAEGLLFNSNISGAFIALSSIPLLNKSFKWFSLPLIACSLNGDIFPIVTILSVITYKFWIDFGFNKFIPYILAILTIVALFLFTDSQDGGRFEAWCQSFDTFMQRDFIFGEGLGWIHDTFYKYAIIKKMKFRSMHNEFLDALYSFGFLGLGVILFNFIKSLKTNNKMILSGIFAIFVNCLGNFPFHISIIAMLCLYYIGRGLNDSTMERKIVS